MSLEEVEAFLIKKALSRFDGNARSAAEALGLSRSAFYRRLQHYGLDCRAAVSTAGCRIAVDTAAATVTTAPRERASNTARRSAAPAHARGPSHLVSSARPRRPPIVALSLLWFGDYTPKVQWTLTLLIAGCGLGFILSARDHIIRPLQTMTNLLAALREGDYSIRARGARADDALGEVLLEINALGETLRTQRLGAFEATALLRTIMAEIDVAVFTFDPERRLRLVNRAGENLLGSSIDKLLGRHAATWVSTSSSKPTRTRRYPDFPRRSRTLGRATERIPRARIAARAGGADRPEQHAARRGAQCLATHRARDRSRIEQLARADQIDCRQPRDAAAARSAAAGLAG